MSCGTGELEDGADAGLDCLPARPERLVVGVDGSPGADRALRWAAAEARLWGAELTVVHCYPLLPDAGPWLEEDERLAWRTVRDVTQRARHNLADVRWSTAVRWAPSGSWAHKLAAAAADADLLIVGSRGLGGFLQLLLGSVSHHVSIHAPTSVVVAKGSNALDVPLGAVVVGVDGSPASLQTLRWGAREARRRGTALRAVHAYAVPAAHVSSPRGHSHEMAARTRDSTRTAARELLAAAIDRAALPPDVDVLPEVLAGSPAGVLVGLTRSDELLVCGPRGLGTIGQVALGSVTDQCLRHARAPVVVLRASGAPGR